MESREERLEEKLCEKMSLFCSFSPFVMGKLFLRKVKFYMRNVKYRCNAYEHDQQYTTHPNQALIVAFQMLMHIHWGTTASARPPRQTKTHIREGRLPEWYHSAQLHPVRFRERTHAISSVPLRSSAMSGPASLQSGFGRASVAFLGQEANKSPGFSLLFAWRSISETTVRLCSKIRNLG